MKMDTVDVMLNVIGLYTPNVHHYVPLRQGMRRDFGGGPVTNPVLFGLEAVIERHLHMANTKLWESIDATEGQRLDAVNRIDEELFGMGREVCSTNQISNCLLHAAVLEQAGVCGTMFSEFEEILRHTAKEMGVAAS